MQVIITELQNMFLCFTDETEYEYSGSEEEEEERDIGEPRYRIQPARRGVNIYGLWIS